MYIYNVLTYIILIEILVSHTSFTEKSKYLVIEKPRQKNEILFWIQCL